jgi:elongation of very long chain fatty acids protein 6
MVLTQPYEETVCTDASTSWGAGPSGAWVFLFIFSKIPELIDTVFIILRKKPLIFLHWYHHITVLMFCWNAYATLAGSGLYFVAMNYTVHALMYGYYCLQALNVCPKSFPAYLITLSQITQMFIGTGVCISCWYYMMSGRACANEMSNLTAGALMYGSYLYLFCEFAVKRYIYPGPKGSKKGGADAKKIE